MLNHPTSSPIMTRMLGLRCCCAAAGAIAAAMAANSASRPSERRRVVLMAWLLGAMSSTNETGGHLGPPARANWKDYRDRRRCTIGPWSNIDRAAARSAIALSYRRQVAVVALSHSLRPRPILERTRSAHKIH